MHDPYVYPGTSILKNNFGTRDQNLLNDLELNAIHDAVLKGFPKGLFNLEHLQTLHKHLFQSIYPWAGELRTVNIVKADSMFCACNLIESQSNLLFKQLAKEIYLTQHSEIKEFVPRFAHYFAEVNAIHPFREGNGRATRAFFELLANHNGYTLDLNKTSRTTFINAIISSYNCDNRLLEDLFTKTLIKGEKYILIDSKLKIKETFIGNPVDKLFDYLQKIDNKLVQQMIKAGVIENTNSYVEINSSPTENIICAVNEKLQTRIAIGKPEEIFLTFPNGQSISYQDYDVLSDLTSSTSQSQANQNSPER